MRVDMRIMACWMALAALAQGAAGAPRIEFDSEAHDWGTAFHGSKLAHVFTIRNKGDSHLLIRRVQSSCGCTVASGWRRAIPPGEESQLTAELDASSRMGKSETSITVRSNDPRRNEVKLTLRALLVKAVEFKPAPYAMFSNFPVGQRAKKEISMWPATDRPIRLAGLEFNQEMLEVGADKIKDELGRRGYRLNIVLKGDVAANRFREAVKVKVELEDTGPLEFSLVVRGNVIGNMNVRPSIVSLGRIGTGPAADAEVRLSRKDSQVFKVKKITSDRPNVTAELAGPRKGVAARIKVRAAMDENTEESGRVAGKLKVFVDLANEPVVEVPYFYILPSRPGGCGAPGHDHGHRH